MSMQIRRLSYALGAEIIGVDIRNALDEKSIGDIHKAFLEHLVLLFRGQPLTRAQHVAFGRQFGELDKVQDFEISSNVPEYPEILLVTNKYTPSKLGYKGNEIWHTDLSNTVIPAMASLLRSVEIPEVGGDTMFSNMYLAYETLSDGMKKLIDGLEGIYVGGGKRIDYSTPERLAETRKLNQAAHSLVRVHPETGRKTLYVSEKVRQLVGMTSEESKFLIQFLCKHATRPQFVYRHQWQRDDLLMWDNRCTNHIAVNDYDDTQVRLMERTIVKGTPSGYAYDGPVE